MRSRLVTTLAAVVAAGALVALTAAPASASPRQNYGAPAGTIVDVAVAASGGGTPDSNPADYDILIQALTVTGLASTLADPTGRFTVFAPNDAAFLRLVTDLTGAAPASEAAALAAIVPLGVPAISSILLGHVVAGKALGPISVLLSRSITTANGSVIRPRLLTLRDENPRFADPRLVLSGLNIRASNGVIHTIDRVLLPASLGA
ncbi:MAG: fasciclin domain-containing protein [Micrococcales bacterium]|nr:fasciclin domain-containing protein [Micrococcales bacterium]